LRLINLSDSNNKKEEESTNSLEDLGICFLDELSLVAFVFDQLFDNVV